MLGSVNALIRLAIIICCIDVHIVKDEYLMEMDLIVGPESGEGIETGIQGHEGPPTR